MFMKNPKLEQINELISLFYEIGRMTAALEKTPKTYGTDEMLYSNESHTLEMIGNYEGITQKDLSDQMYRTKGATSIVIDKLVKRGLVEKRCGVIDGRSNSLFLTEKGKFVNECHVKYDNQMIGKWFESLELTEDEMKVTCHVLRICLDYYEKNIYKSK